MLPSASHRQSIDLARFGAAFGVVVAHALVQENDWSGHLALGLFLILTAFLAMQSFYRAGGKYDIVARSQKLVVPWLFWSAAFRVIDWKVSDAPGPFQLLSDPWSLLVGSTVHLWFLPFIMLAMALVAPVGSWTTSPVRLRAALLALVVVSVPMLWAHKNLALPVPIAQWLFALPVYILGLLVGVAHAKHQIVWPICAAAVLSAVLLIVSGGKAWSGTPIFAVLLFEAFWRLPLRARFLPAIGQASFGIYLVHPFFMLLNYKMFGVDVNLIFAAVSTFVLSWMAVMVLRMFPLTRRVI